SLRPQASTSERRASAGASTLVNLRATGTRSRVRSVTSPSATRSRSGREPVTPGRSGGPSAIRAAYLHGSESRLGELSQPGGSLPTDGPHVDRTLRPGGPPPRRRGTGGRPAGPRAPVAAASPRH